jgi:hypothetical protein
VLQRLFERCGADVRPTSVVHRELKDNPMPSNESSDLRMLRALLRETIKRRLQWNGKGDRYYTSFKGKKLEIIFENIANARGDAIGLEVAIVRVPRMELTYFSGTTGMYLVRQILHKGNDDFRDHSDTCERNACGFLRALKG